MTQRIAAHEDQRGITAPVWAFIELYERGDIDALVAQWTPNAVNHAGMTPEAEQRALAEGRRLGGVEGLKLVFVSLLTAFPDRKWRVEDMRVDGDIVTCRFTVSGTHQGVPVIPVEGGLLLQKLQPTGKSYSVSHIHMFRIEFGKIAEHWAVRDDLGLLVQLGAIGPPMQDK